MEIDHVFAPGARRATVVCVCICLVHQVVRPFLGAMLSYLSSIVFIIFPIFSAAILGLPFHLVWSTLHILGGWWFHLLFCTRSICVFVFLPPLDTIGTFYSRIYLHNLISLVAFLSLPLLYCYIVFLSSFLGIQLFFGVFLLPSFLANISPCISVLLFLTYCSNLLFFHSTLFSWVFLYFLSGFHLRYCILRVGFLFLFSIGFYLLLLIVLSLLIWLVLCLHAWFSSFWLPIQSVWIRFPLVGWWLGSRLAVVGLSLVSCWILPQFVSFHSSLVPMIRIHMWLLGLLQFPQVPIWLPFSFLWIPCFLFLQAFSVLTHVSYLSVL